MKLIKLGAILVLICLWWPTPSGAYDQKQALRGLKGVKVKVKYCNPELERLLLPRSEFEAAIERKLKKLSVPVFKQARPPALSTLSVTINTFRARSKRIIIYSVSVSLMEWAYLKRDIGSVGDLMEVRAINWFEGKVGFVGPRSVKDLLEEIDTLLQNFIYDYLGANSSWILIMALVGFWCSSPNLS